VILNISVDVYVLLQLVYAITFSTIAMAHVKQGYLDVDIYISRARDAVKQCYDEPCEQVLRAHMAM
jgi:hypothetical protein